MDEPQILVEELEKRFGETQVLKSVNMRVERSEALASARRSLVARRSGITAAASRGA